jgi:hypothetical protein
VSAAVPGQAYADLAARWESEIRDAQLHPGGGEYGIMRDAVVGQKLTCLRELQRAIGDDDAAVERRLGALADARETPGGAE